MKSIALHQVVTALRRLSPHCALTHWHGQGPGSGAVRLQQHLVQHLVQVVSPL